MRWVERKNLATQLEGRVRVPEFVVLETSELNEQRGSKRVVVRDPDPRIEYVGCPLELAALLEHLQELGMCILAQLRLLGERSIHLDRFFFGVGPRR